MNNTDPLFPVNEIASFGSTTAYICSSVTRYPFLGCRYRSAAVARADVDAGKNVHGPLSSVTSSTSNNT